MTSSVTMAGLAPVGVKQQRARRVAAAAPARAHLGSAFTSGGGKSLEGQRLSVAVAPAARARRGSRCVTSMAAKIAGYIKLAIEAGKANPAPPIGPALGAKVRFLRLFPPVRWSGERSGRNAGGGEVPGDALATITRPLERAVRARVGCLMGIPTPSPRVWGASPSRRPRARVSRRAETLTLFAFFASPYLTLKHDRISNADRRALSRPFLSYPGCEHHDVLQGVQRQDPGPGGHHHPRRDHRLRGARASHLTDPQFHPKRSSAQDVAFSIRLKTQWLTRSLSTFPPNLAPAGQVLHLRPQDPSRRRSHQEGCGHRQGCRQRCHRHRRLHHARPARGDCQDEAPGSQRGQDRIRHAHRRGHRSQHGRDHRRLGDRGVQGWLPRGEGGHLGHEAR